MRWVKVDRERALREYVEELRAKYGNFYRWFAWYPVHDHCHWYWLEVVERRDYFTASGWRYGSQYQPVGETERRRNEVINGFDW